MASARFWRTSALHPYLWFCGSSAAHEHALRAVFGQKWPSGSISNCTVRALAARLRSLPAVQNRLPEVKEEQAGETRTVKIGGALQVFGWLDGASHGCMLLRSAAISISARVLRYATRFVTAKIKAFSEPQASAKVQAFARMARAPSE